MTREEVIRVLLMYETLVVGKRDCNKFGYMLLKLLCKVENANQMDPLELDHKINCIVY